MSPYQYRNMILRAVAAPDGQMLDLLAAQLADSMRAKEILRAKGYRPPGASTSAMARMVPDARRAEVK